METINFVLGALSGLFLVGIVYAFVGVLKMSKQIKNLQEEIQSINKDLGDTHRTIDVKNDNLWNELDQRINDVNHVIDNKERDLLQDIEKNFEDLRRHSDYLADEVNRKQEEVTKYIDSRIDKTIDALCMRMDTKITINRQNPEEGD